MCNVNPQTTLVRSSPDRIGAGVASTRSNLSSVDSARHQKPLTSTLRVRGSLVYAWTAGVEVVGIHDTAGQMQCVEIGSGGHCREHVNWKFFAHSVNFHARTRGDSDKTIRFRA